MVLSVAGGRSFDKKVLRDRVYDLVLDLLLRGDLAPGERLSIDVIARQLEVSPTPVREAMVELERTGLVTREALKGYRVAPPLSTEQIQELFQARLVLETGAVDLAVASRDGLVEDLEAAQRRHEATAQELRAADEVSITLYQEYFNADWGFHRVIFDHAHNRFLLEMSDSLGTHLHRMRQSITHGDNDVDEAITEHRAIIDALTSGVPGAAHQAMQAHIEAVRNRAVRDA